MLLALLAAALLFAAGAGAGSKAELKVLRVTPSGGNAPLGRQVVIQFDRPVVPVGRMERRDDEVPVSISPRLACQWRWLNTSALCCQLSEADALTPATAYRVSVRPGLTARDGAVMSREETREFSTLRPRVEWAGVDRWTSPVTPVFRVNFNMPVTAESVGKHLFLEPAGGSGRRVALKPLAEPPDPEEERYGEGLSVHTDGDPAAEGEAGASVPGISSHYNLVPASRLAPDTIYNLREEPGLVNPRGRLPGNGKRQVASTCTFGPFRYVGVGYRDLRNRDVAFTPGDKCGETPAANPLGSVHLLFSAPVDNSMVAKKAVLSPDLAGGRTDYDPWANRSDWSQLYGQHTRGQRYSVWLPEYLKAARTYTLSFPAEGFRDQFGRTLTNPGEYSFCTDHRAPRLVMPNNISVLELYEDTRLPLYVTNIESFRVEYEKFTPGGELSRYLHYTRNVPPARDISFAVPLGIREAIGEKGGLARGDLSGSPSPGSGNYDFICQVTPFAVHVKRGFYNSLVWVCELATGKPVADADVTVFYNPFLHEPGDEKVLARARTDEKGLARLPGNEFLDPERQLNDWMDGKFLKPVLQARVEKDGTMAVLPLCGQFMVQFTQWSYPDKIYGHIKTWGATAQGVYRCGDTIDYKIWVRNEANKTLSPAPLKTYKLSVIDPMGKTAFEKDDITLSEFGALSGGFKVPGNAAMGWYSFRLSADFTDYDWQPMRVLVTDFTPAPFKVSAEANGELFRPGQSMQLTARASMHAGGPYADAKARITASLSPAAFTPDTAPASRFFYSSWADEEKPRRNFTLLSDTGQLDASGVLTKDLVLPETPVIYGNISVEAAVSDERGKYVAATTRASYLARDRLVGLKADSWLNHQGESAGYTFLVADEKGEPVAGVPVSFTAERRVTKASRVRGPGNAFVTQYIQEWEPACSKELASAKEPAAFSFVPERPGSYRVTASVKDTEGRPHKTSLWSWVAGKGRVLWEGPQENILSIVAEKTEYRVGETARFLVKNPYENARALITVERLGVIEESTVTWDTSTPVIEIPVTPDMIPGFYLSAVAFSPRVEKPLSDTGLDLGKPSFRIGYQTIRVRDPYKELKVTALPDRKKAKPGEKVTVKLSAVPLHPDGKEPVELAVAVLDEAVFDLVQGGEAAFDPYWGFYNLDSLDLRNYNLIYRLAGRQKFEKKGQNQGGGGGSAPDVSMRSIFKYVCFWDPVVKTDKKGNAEISFTLPDNLTSFRILAMAATPTDRLGLGQAGVAVSLPTEVRPVMPNQVTEKDWFEAGFSVANRTDKTRELTVLITAKGPLAAPVEKKARVTIEPYGRTVVFAPVKTSGPGEIVFSAKAWDASDGDGVVSKVPVLAMRSLVTGAAYGSFTGETAAEKIAFPADIWPDLGRVGAVLAPSSIGGLGGAFAYIKDYPYLCWEQRLTKGVMAAQYLRLRPWLPAELKWEGAGELAKAMLEDAAGFQAPDGGMCYYIARNEYVSPYLSAYTALCFAWMAEAGYTVPSLVEERLQAYLQKMLKRDEMPSYFDRGMASTVRAVALAALARRGKLPDGELLRFRPELAYMSLFGKAHYLIAAVSSHASEKLVAEAADAIMAHADQSGGKFQFVETLDSGYARILASPLRTNGAILSAMLALEREPYGKALAGGVPEKLARFIAQSRKNRDHWENTQENMFCVNAVARYAREYEKTEPDATVTAYLGPAPIGKAVFTGFKQPAAEIFRPIAPADPGSVQDLILHKQGPGRIYYSARLSYAPKAGFTEPRNAGIEIHREYSVERNGEFILLKSPMRISRGELVRVDLFVKIGGARNFVVVEDPVPGGLEPVNRNLATASGVDAAKGSYRAAGGSFWFNANDWFEYGISRWSFYHEELGDKAARFYSEYLPPGNYHLSYTAQAIAAGGFIVMPSKAEEMYDPDVYGLTPGAELTVAEKIE